MKKYILYIIILFTVNCSLFTTWAWLSFILQDENIIVDCPFEVDIILDTEGKKTNTVDIKIFDNQNLQIQDFLWDKGIFQYYSKPKIAKVRYWDNKNWKATYIMWTTNSNQTIKWKKTFGTIILTAKEVGEFTLEFYMIPNFNADDSNISYLKEWKIFDALNNVENIVLQIQKGECKPKNLIKRQEESNKKNFLEYVLEQAAQDTIINKQTNEIGQIQNNPQLSQTTKIQIKKNIKSKKITTTPSKRKNFRTRLQKKRYNLRIKLS